MPPLRVAIAGCHRMLTRIPGSHNWAAAFDAVPETAIAGVFDRSAETRAAFRRCWGEVPEFDNFDALLEAVQPDLACIATRQTMHADQIERAVAAGVRGILCDKPLATSLAEMDRILDACRRARVALAFGLDRRWWAAYRAARELITAGAIGPLRAVLAFAIPNLINHGCHWYDTALALAGDPEIAWVSGRVEDTSGDPPDSARRLDPPGTAEVGLANGVALYVTPAGRPGPAFEALGDRGRLLLLDDARQPQLWTVQMVDGRARIQPQEVTLPSVATDWPPGPAAVRDLVQAARAGGATACDLDQARRATELGFAIHASHAAGGRRLALAEVDRSLRIASLPWGNE